MAEIHETAVIRPGQQAALAGGERGYVDWGAILAGAAIAAGTSIVLTGFATGLGLGAISADPEEGISGFGLMLTGLFTVVSMAAAYMLGGYIAGRMRRRVDGAERDEVTARDGIHGLVVWALGMVVAGLMAFGAASSGAKAVGSAAGSAVEAAGSAVGGIAQGAGQLAGGVVSGVGQAVGGAAAGAGQAVAPALEDMMPAGLAANPVDYIQDTLLRPGAQPVAPPAEADAEDIAREIGSILANVVRTGEAPSADIDYLRRVIAARTGLPPPEVDARVNEAVQRAQAIRAEAEQRLEQPRAEAERLRAEAEQRLEEAQQQAIEAAEQARVAGILTAFLLAASAILAAAAAYVGAVRGGRHRDEGRLWGWLSYRH